MREVAVRITGIVIGVVAILAGLTVMTLEPAAPAPAVIIPTQPAGPMLGEVAGWAGSSAVWPLRPEPRVQATTQEQEVRRPCRDGSTTKATGRGACSSHGGLR